MLKRKRFIVYSENPFESIIGSLKKAKGIISLNLGGLEDNMVGCCEVAVRALVLNAVSLAIYAGYNIKLKAKEAQLEKRTKELEKKNGAEQRQINELKAEIEKLKGGKYD